MDSLKLNMVAVDQVGKHRLLRLTLLLLLTGSENLFSLQLFPLLNDLMQTLNKVRPA